MAASKWGPFVARRNVATDLASGGCATPFSFGDPSVHYGPVTIEDNIMNSRVGGVEVNSVSEVNVKGNAMTVGQGPGCGVDYGVGVTNTPSGSIKRNTIIDTKTVAGVKNSNVTVCGNRLTPSGPFDQPVRC